MSSMRLGPLFGYLAIADLPKVEKGILAVVGARCEVEASLVIDLRWSDVARVLKTSESAGHFRRAVTRLKQRGFLQLRHTGRGIETTLNLEAVLREIPLDLFGFLASVPLGRDTLLTVPARRDSQSREPRESVPIRGPLDGKDWPSQEGHSRESVPVSRASASVESTSLEEEQGESPRGGTAAGTVSDGLTADATATAISTYASLAEWATAKPARYELLGSLLEACDRDGALAAGVLAVLEWALCEGFGRGRISPNALEGALLDLGTRGWPTRGAAMRAYLSRAEASERRSAAADAAGSIPAQSLRSTARKIWDGCKAAGILTAPSREAIEDGVRHLVTLGEVDDAAEFLALLDHVKPWEFREARTTEWALARVVERLETLPAAVAA